MWATHGGPGDSEPIQPAWRVPYRGLPWASASPAVKRGPHWISPGRWYEQGVPGLFFQMLTPSYSWFLLEQALLPQLVRQMGKPDPPRLIPHSSPGSRRAAPPASSGPLAPRSQAALEGGQGLLGRDPRSIRSILDRDPIAGLGFPAAGTLRGARERHLFPSPNTNPSCIPHGGGWDSQDGEAPYPLPFKDLASQKEGRRSPKTSISPLCLCAQGQP